MVRKGLTVNWDDTAKRQLRVACNYIMQDSLKNAQKVRKDIFEMADSLAFQPEKHPLDKYKLDNDGTSGLSKNIICESAIVFYLAKSKSSMFAIAVWSHFPTNPCAMVSAIPLNL